MKIITDPKHLTDIVYEKHLMVCYASLIDLLSNAEGVAHIRLHDFCALLMQVTANYTITNMETLKLSSSSFCDS